MHFGDEPLNFLEQNSSFSRTKCSSLACPEVLRNCLVDFLFGEKFNARGHVGITLSLEHI